MRSDVFRTTKTVLTFLTCCITLAAALAYAQAGQTATVVSFEKVAANEQHPENADQYKIAMRMNGVIYLCHASGPIANFMGWSPGKEFPATLDEKGKTMTVTSPNGQTVLLNIAGKKTPK